MKSDRRARGPRAPHRRRGVTAVELALVLTPLMMLMIGTFEYCRYMMVRSLAENACREGARYAVVNTYDKTTAEVQAVVTSRMAGLGNNIENMTTTINRVNMSTGANTGAWNDARFGQGISVTVEGTFRPIAPQFLQMSTTIPVRCTATMLSEAN